MIKLLNLLWVQKCMASLLVSLHRPFSGSWTWLQPSPDASTSLTTITVSSRDTSSRNTPGTMLSTVDFVWRFWEMISTLIISVSRKNAGKKKKKKNWRDLIGVVGVTLLHTHIAQIFHPGGNIWHSGIHFQMILSSDRPVHKKTNLGIRYRIKLTFGLKVMACFWWRTIS